MSCCGDISHGAAGIAKAIVGADRAPDDVIEQRRAICRECDRAKPCIRNVGRKCRCKECGCLLKAKTTLASESCPLGKWSSSIQVNQA